MEKHGQLFGRHEPLTSLAVPGRRVIRSGTVQAIGIGTGVDRMSQDRQDSIGRGGLPLQFPDSPAPMAAKPQSQVIHDQITEDRVGGAEFLELLEDQADHPSRLFIGFQDDFAR